MIQKEESTKKTGNHLDAILKLITVILPAASLLIGLWQFQKQQHFNETQEFKRKVWDKKLEAYNSLANISSQVMVTPPGIRFDTLGRRYWQVYWQTMSMFDSTVETYMGDFGEEINSITRGDGLPSVLRSRGYQMLRAAKTSLDSAYLKVNTPAVRYFGK